MFWVSENLFKLASPPCGLKTECKEVGTAIALDSDGNIDKLLMEKADHLQKEAKPLFRHFKSTRKE